MKIRTLVVTGAVLVFGELVAMAVTPVPGTTIPAMSGHGWPTANDPCFTTSFAQVENTCVNGAQHLLVIPAAVPSTNIIYTASAQVAGGSSTSGSTCQAMGIGPDNKSFWFSSLVTSTAWETVQPLNLGQVGVPTNGTLHFECEIGTADWYGIGGRVINVSFK